MMGNRKNKVLLIHGLFWLYFLYDQYVNFDGNWSFSFGLFNITFLIVSLTAFYLNYCIVLPFVFKSFGWIKLVISQLIVFVLFGILRYLFDQVLTLWLFNEQNYFEGTDFLFIIYDNFHFGFKTIFTSMSIFLIVHTFETIRLKEALEKEKREAEITALKAQINPHFLFNTLNNIYALIQFNPNDALKAVNELSLMMRFTTYESQKDTISIMQEIDFMKSLIEITKLSYPNIDFMKANFDESVLSYKIEPYLLSPFLENAIKHGEISSNDPIMLKLSNEGTQIKFYVKNKISEKNKDQSPGIGLENIKKRLTYLYPNKHQLNINIYEDYFSVDLIIDLDEKA